VSRIHGKPVIRAGSMVIRSYAMFTEYAAGPGRPGLDFRCHQKQSTDGNDSHARAGRCAAPVFAGRRYAMVRRGLLVSGSLCLAGLVGPALNAMAWREFGIFGYAVVLPLTCLALSRAFASASNDRFGASHVGGGAATRTDEGSARLDDIAAILGDGEWEITAEAAVWIPTRHVPRRWKCSTRWTE